jgi:hypothetical protein
VIGLNLFRTKRTFQPILESLGLKKKWFVLSYKTEFTYQGEKMFLNIRPSNRPTTVQFEISTPCNSLFEFCIDRRDKNNPFSSIFKPIKTGNVDFDNTFAVTSSNNEVVVRKFFEVFQLRELISSIMKDMAGYIILESGWLTIGVRRKVGAQDIKELPTRLLELKHLIIKNLQDVYLIPTGKASRIPLITVYTIPPVFFILQLAVTVYLQHKAGNNFMSLSSFQLILVSLAFSLPFILVYLYLSYRVVSGYPAPQKKFVICVLFAVVWVFSTAPLVQGLNGYLDKTSPVLHTFKVIDKYTGGKKETYFVVLEDAQNQQLKFSVTRSEYRKVVPGRTFIKVWVKKGALGIPWAYRYAIY